MTEGFRWTRGEAAVVFHKAALPVEPIPPGVVTPSQSFTRKISRLVGAVAILRTEPLSILPPLEMTNRG